jgi:hypothetical protein
MNNEFTIWQCYHDENLIKQYGLQENNVIKLFNTSDRNYKGCHLNQLSTFLSEGCCLVYPYLNDLKSDYIGFMHYRRCFNIDDLSLKKLSQNNIQYFHYHTPIDEFKKHREEYGIEGFDYKTPYKNIENHCFFWSMDKCGIMNDMIEFLQMYYPQYLESEKEIHDMYWACIFVCNWNIYEELARFIYSYISFINTKYHLNWDKRKWIQHIYYKFLNYNQTHHPKTPYNVYCKRVEDDGSVWCELPFWGEQGWRTCPLNGYISKLGNRTNLYRVYAYNIEFLTSVFIHNHQHFIDMNNTLYFVNSDGTKTQIEFNHKDYIK